MLQSVSLLYIFGPAMVAGSIYLGMTHKKRVAQNLSELCRAIEHFKITSIIFGILVLILWFLLPSTAVLITFGYPEDLQAINSQERTLDYLQRYNKAIVRTAEVVQWFLFLFIWWFLTSIFGVMKAIKSVKGENRLESNEWKLSIE